MSDARYGCPCGFAGWHLGRFSQAWHEAHLHHHFAVFPAAAQDVGTVRNLRDFATVDRARDGGKQTFSERDT